MASDQNQTGSVSGPDRGVIQWAARVPELIWSPVVALILIALAGCLGLLFDKPWLFASLGPSAYLIAHSPSERSALPYNMIVGHMIGVCAGLGAVTLLGSAQTPSVFITHHLTAQQVLSSALALGLAIPMELLAKASHPPAAATVLLMTLGGFPASLHSVLDIMAGVLIIATAGEVFRDLRLVK